MFKNCDDGKLRCPLNFMGRLISEKVINYHDFRWCKPCFDDDELFAMLALEIMQAGLSWGVVLEKEFEIRKAFENFNVILVANFDIIKIEVLMKNSNIIKNYRKIKSIIENARAFLRIREKFGSFCEYIWGFTSGRVIDHRLDNFINMPCKDSLSRKISCDLKMRGFSFVGPVIVYSYLQAIGIYNDHHVDCEFR